MLRFVIAQAMRLLLIGEVAGLVVSQGLTHAASGLFYGVSPSDPWTVVAAMAVLALVALVASYVPARLASRVDPIVARQYE
ncbi:MAG: hypothetical protein WBQ08_23305 [Candidatus Sulfotelmatobacter sp.]